MSRVNAFVLENAAFDHVELQHQVVSYREMLQLAVGLLAERQRELEQLRTRHSALIEEYRAFRARALRRAAA